MTDNPVTEIQDAAQTLQAAASAAEKNPTGPEAAYYHRLVSPTFGGAAARWMAMEAQLHADDAAALDPDDDGTALCENFPHALSLARRLRQEEQAAVERLTTPCGTYSDDPRRPAVLQALADWGFTTGKGSRAMADHILTLLDRQTPPPSPTHALTHRNENTA